MEFLFIAATVFLPVCFQLFGRHRQRDAVSLPWQRLFVNAAIRMQQIAMGKSMGRVEADDGAPCPRKMGFVLHDKPNDLTTDPLGADSQPISLFG
jgi:hypothetical protein